MKRIHLVEFEDLEWFPSWLRACMTRLIIVFMRVVGGERVLQHQIALALEATGEQDVVDLGSGAGGSMPVVLEALRAKGQMQSLTLTDLYPNPETIAHLEARNIEGLRYHPEPVDATDLATAPAGLKTMINSFHHMRPEQARAILATARENAAPLLVYELAANKPPNIVWWLFLPLGLLITGFTAVLFTPFVKPLTLRQLFFTFVIPVIPFFYAWDGQASMIRTYDFDDLNELLQGLESDDDYTWEMREAEDAGGKKLGYVLLGRPV